LPKKIEQQKFCCLSLPVKRANSQIANDCEHIDKPHDLYDDYMSSGPEKDLKK